VAIVPDIPESVASVGSDATKLEGPDIVVVGKFLKRLAYQSGMGADLAPVIVGQITMAPISQDELDRRTDSAASGKTVSVWLPILLACLIGLASAAIVMWRTSASARRSRELRVSHREAPNAFLQDLHHASQPVSNSNEDR
jgi:hypothetical protein